MAGWAKLFGSIVTSSVWCEDDKTLRVWIAFLALSDSEGRVEGSIPGLANLCRVTPEEMRAALNRLSSPDPDSRTPDHEGRRIEAILGGWRILNYLSYRDKGQAKEGSRAPYMRKRRECNALQPGATRGTEAEERSRSRGKKKTDTSAGADARVLAYWQERTSTKLRSSKAEEQVRARLRARLREGCTESDLRACVDFALIDSFYFAKGYHKKPDVMWRSAERVGDLATRYDEAAPNQRAVVAEERRGPTPDELARLDAETDR